jgi:hypothetical protein
MYAAMSDSAMLFLNDIKDRGLHDEQPLLLVVIGGSSKYGVSCFIHFRIRLDEGSFCVIAAAGELIGSVRLIRNVLLIRCICDPVAVCEAEIWTGSVETLS